VDKFTTFWCIVSSRLCIPKIIEISPHYFDRVILKKQKGGSFFETQYTYLLSIYIYIYIYLLSMSKPTLTFVKGRESCGQIHRAKGHPEKNLFLLLIAKRGTTLTTVARNKMLHIQ